MNTFFVLLSIVTGLGVLAYFRASLALATIVGSLGLLVLTKVSGGLLASSVVLVTWLLLAVMAALNIRQLRHRFVVEPALALFRRDLPTISSTEQEALDAGTVWWDAELFSGDPDWEKLLSLPAEQLSADEQNFLDGPVNTLCSMIDDWEISRTGELPAEIWRFLKDEGFLGLIIPREFGGKGFSARAHSRVIEKIASRSSAAAVSVMVPNSLGPAELLLRYGSEAQKTNYLPKLACGDEIPCFALTNPFAGSDAAAIPDAGIVCRENFNGQEVLGIRITWEKRYITLSPVATVLGLAFRLFDPDGLLGDTQDIGITLALLPADHPGVQIGRRHYPARQAFQNGPNSGTNVFIPMDWVIGGQEQCGRGWRMLMNCLAAGRAISLPSSSVAGLKVCARTTGAYAAVRKQFNVPIGKFEGVQEAIARIVVNTYLVDSARGVTAGALDIGEQPAVLSALLKYQATERLRQSVNDAMDVHGGRGVCDGPANYLLAAYTAAPVAITVEGANILTRSLIIFGQGAMRCHPWLQKEIAAAGMTNLSAAVAAFDVALFGHAGSLLTNAARTLFRNATGGLIGSDPSVGEANYWYAQLERASASFSIVADCALLQLGGALKRKEKLSGRFADIIGELYLLSCALKRFEDDGRPDSDLPVIELAFQNGLYCVYDNLDEILANLPLRSSAWILRRLVFPWGRWWRRGSDELGGRVADLLVTSRSFRDQICAGMYFNDVPDDLIGCLEHAVNVTALSQEAEDKLRAAQKEGKIPAHCANVIGAGLEGGIITSVEAEQLRASVVALRRAIDVDDFDSEELWRKGRAPQVNADAA
ncbi:MAG: acyl-CoA dehydrogenase [Gammaproteobacteria bacterium]|jgi:acyl-CoA dehydrogenase